MLRFSVVSRRLLSDIHAMFSAEEVFDVDILAVNRESILGLAEAGHAREKARRRPERAEFERRKIDPDNSGDEALTHRTIACVSGFLVEPLNKRVRLISPEPSSDRWPDGYAVFGEERFETADQLAGALMRLVEHNMLPDPPDRLALQRGVSVAEESRTAVRAEGRGHRVSLRSKRRSLAHLPALADAFRNGADVAATAKRVVGRFGVDPDFVRKDVAELWRHGVLIEEIFDFSRA